MLSLRKFSRRSSERRYLLERLFASSEKIWDTHLKTRVLKFPLMTLALAARLPKASPIESTSERSSSWALKVSLKLSREKMKGRHWLVVSHTITAVSIELQKQSKRKPQLTLLLGKRSKPRKYTQRKTKRTSWEPRYDSWWPPFAKLQKLPLTEPMLGKQLDRFQAQLSNPSILESHLLFDQG